MREAPWAKPKRSEQNGRLGERWENRVLRKNFRARGSLQITTLNLVVTIERGRLLYLYLHFADFFTFGLLWGGIM